VTLKFCLFITYVIDSVTYAITSLKLRYYTNCNADVYFITIVESAAVDLGTNIVLMGRVADWCNVEDHQGVRGKFFLTNNLK
jgi:hypothetical protein